MRNQVLTLLAMLIVNIAIAQSVGIGTNTPDSSAVLDIKSSTKGFLIPRMNTIQRDAISNPSQGLKIFNTDDRCEDTFDGQKWAKNCVMKQNGAATLPGDSWRPRADFPGGYRTGIVSFVIDGIAYVGTGKTENNVDKSDFYKYDPTTNEWTQIANIGGLGRYDAVAFSVNGKGYVGTGKFGCCNRLDDLWEYNPALNTWTQKEDFGGSARSEAVAFSINGKGYIGTGFDNTNTYKKDFWEYDPTTNEWTQKADFGGDDRSSAVGFSINGKGYIGAGYNYGNTHHDFWEFTPAGGALGTWVQKANFGLGGSGAISFTIGSKGYVYSSSFYPNNFREFDPSINNWISKENYVGTVLGSPFGFSIGSNGYVGYVGLGNVKEVWEYNQAPLNGIEYKENIPNDVVRYIGHDWSSEGNKLYTSLSNVETTIRGNLLISNIESRNLNGIDHIKIQNDGGKLTIGNESSFDFVNILGNNDASLTNNGLIVLGPTNGQNIVIDKDEIIARNNGLVSTLTLQNDGGDITMGKESSLDHVNILGFADASLTTDGLLTIGPSYSTNIVIDRNEIMARNNGTSTTLLIQNEGGDINLGGTNSILSCIGEQIIQGGGTGVPFQILGGNEASLANTEAGYLLIGSATGSNMMMDVNEIYARSNGATTTLHLQTEGGSVNIGNPPTSPAALNVNGDAYKNTGGSAWLTTSDKRLKENIIPYNEGLSELNKINPVWYKYNKNSGCDTTQNFVGIIAQELQNIAPYMVKESNTLAQDGTNYLTVDNSAMTYMLINAVKELAMQNEILKKENEDLKNEYSTNKQKVSSIIQEIEEIKSLLNINSIAKNEK